ELGSRTVHHLSLPERRAACTERPQPIEQCVVSSTGGLAKPLRLGDVGRLAGFQPVEPPGTTCCERGDGIVRRSTAARNGCVIESSQGGEVLDEVPVLEPRATAKPRRTLDGEAG